MLVIVLVDFILLNLDLKLTDICYNVSFQFIQFIKSISPTTSVQQILKLQVITGPFSPTSIIAYITLKERNLLK